VIDIAAHLQKVAPVGGIVVSEAAAKGLPGGPGTVGTELVEAQNVFGLVWQPRAVPTSLPTVAPPPLQG